MLIDLCSPRFELRVEAGPLPLTHHMSSLHQTISTLGLSSSAAHVYLAGLELGAASVLELARKSKVKRTTIYGVLEELKARNLFETTKKGVKERLIMAAPERLVLLEKERLANLEKVLPDLKAIWNEPAEKPKVRYLEGLAGWEELQSEILTSKQPYLHISGSQKFFLQQIGQAKMISLLKSKDAAGIKRKVLVSHDFSTKNILGKTPDTLGEYRFLPDNQQVETQLYLYNGNRTAFFSPEPEIMIVIVENAAIYQLQEALFNTLWQKSTIIT